MFTEEENEKTLSEVIAQIFHRAEKETFVFPMEIKTNNSSKSKPIFRIKERDDIEDIRIEYYINFQMGDYIRERGEGIKEDFVSYRETNNTAKGFFENVFEYSFAAWLNENEKAIFAKWDAFGEYEIENWNKLSVPLIPSILSEDMPEMQDGEYAAIIYTKEKLALGKRVKRELTENIIHASVCYANIAPHRFKHVFFIDNMRDSLIDVFINSASIVKILKSGGTALYFFTREEGEIKQTPYVFEKINLNKGKTDE